MRKNKSPSILILSAVFSLIVVFDSCVDHDLTRVKVNCNGMDTVRFSLDISPIITNSCALEGCHNGDNGDDLNWTIFENFQSHSANVQDRITRNVAATGHMPKVGSISVDDIQKIYCWVEQGAKNN